MVVKRDENDMVVVQLKQCCNDPGAVFTNMFVKNVNQETLQSDSSPLNSFRRNPTKMKAEIKKQFLVHNVAEE